MIIIYMANTRIPNKNMYGIQIMKTCDGFDNLGH